ncbi:WD40-repeat-containing domain protein [Mycena leptocephala]|nr:WD40-repeat-containing domain protein [Mycena leptocephala]
MAFLFPQASSKNDNYVCRKTLRGHTGPIDILGASDDGKLLASGGADGTLVWDLERMRQLRSPSNPGLRGSTSAVLWIKRADDPGNTLFHGTGEGYVVGWRQGTTTPDFEEVICKRTTNPGEITGFAFDAVSNRFAVCNRNGVVQVYTLDVTMNLSLLYSKSIPNGSPKAIAFGATNGNERDILIFNLYSGHVDVLRLGEVVERWNLGQWIGDACLDSSKTAMCIGDPSSGVDVHRLQGNSHVRIKSFPIPRTKGKGSQALRVCFADQNQKIVCGSDHGVVYVFDRPSGDTVAHLRIDASVWVQTVAATECNGVSTLFAAKSYDAEAAGTPNGIYVWQRSPGRRVAGMPCHFMTMVHAITLLLTLALLYQNVVFGLGMLNRF